MLLQIEHKDDTLQDMMELAKASGGGGLRPTQVAAACDPRKWRSSATPSSARISSPAAAALAAFSARRSSGTGPV
ncbi:hypothetical protein PF001_g30277, partial [Phytophthora fragariae]